MLRIIQLTDIHIDTPDKPYFDIDVKSKFTAALDKIKTYTDVDLLIISGDLAAHNGEIEAYEWIVQQLQSVTTPYLVMAGNHDNVHTMQQIFPINPQHVHDGMLYFKQIFKEMPLLFLDTSSYTLPQIQIDWLKQQPAIPSLLFMHHPPTFCHCTYMDSKYPLHNRQQVWSQLIELSHIRHIFCGHYHTARTVHKDNKVVHIAPSSMMQIATRTPHFAVASYQPGWRVIEWDGTQLNSYTEELV